jgi:hypothetical protein
MAIHIRRREFVFTLGGAKFFVTRPPDGKASRDRDFQAIIERASAPGRPAGNDLREPGHQDQECHERKRVPRSSLIVAYAFTCNPAVTLSTSAL